jgi:hypothetical protein
MDLRPGSLSCGELRVVDGKPTAAPMGVVAACEAFLAACAHEGTAADPVVRALAAASSRWLAAPSPKRLRSALVEVLGLLD